MYTFHCLSFVNHKLKIHGMHNCIPNRHFWTVNIVVSNTIAGVRRFFSASMCAKEMKIKMQKRVTKKNTRFIQKKKTLLRLRNNPNWLLQIIKRHKKSHFTIHGVMIWQHNSNRQFENRSFSTELQKLHSSLQLHPKITERVATSWALFPCAVFFFVVAMHVVQRLCYTEK